MSGRIAAVVGVTVILAGCGGASRRQRLACRDLRRTFSRLRRRPTLARAAGENSDDLQFVAGVRAWF